MDNKINNNNKKTYSNDTKSFHIEMPYAGLWGAEAYPFMHGVRGRMWLDMSQMIYSFQFPYMCLDCADMGRTCKQYIKNPAGFKLTTFCEATVQLVHQVLPITFYHLTGFRRDDPGKWNAHVIMLC